MHGLPRRVFVRELKKIKWQRKLCTTSVLKNDESYVVKSPVSDFVVPKMNVIQRLWKERASFNNLVAIESAETKKSYTFQQLDKYSVAFATSLIKKFGVKQGDIVGIMMPNCPEYPVVAFGAIQAGCALTTINPIYKELEVTHQISITEPKIMITVPESYDTVVKGLKQAKSNAKIIVVEKPNVAFPNGAAKYSEMAENGEADYALIEKIKRKEDDIVLIPFSSGTTGLPKGVAITDRNIVAAVESMANKAYSYPILATNDFQDIVPCILPFYHIYGLIVLMFGHLSKGCKLVTMSSFSANLYLNLLKTYDVSLLYLVPPIAILLAKHPDVTPEHFRNVRTVMCGAAPLAGSDVEAIIERSKKTTGIEFMQGYGATETTSICTTTFKGTENLDYDSCGLPLAGISLKFVDPTSGKAVPIGETGEVYIKGPVVMKGYYKDEAATKETVTEDGYFKTGDLARFNNAPGSGLIITDRIKELIKVKGLQVAPAELESVLRSHPKVQDAGVIGVPHEFYGEVPKAIVILKKEAKMSSEELKDYVAERVATFKKIEEIVFVDQIPKTGSGKILRRELKKMYA